MGREMSVMEFEDDPDRVYLIGIDLRGADEGQADNVMAEIREAVGSSLDDAEIIVAPLPVEGMQVAQLDADEVQELIDYYNIKEEANDG